MLQDEIWITGAGTVNVVKDVLSFELISNSRVTVNWVFSLIVSVSSSTVNL